MDDGQGFAQSFYRYMGQRVRGKGTRLKARMGWMYMNSVQHAGAGNLRCAHTALQLRHAAGPM